jgi:tetratricopeptide (TPR) repeat protein
MEYEKKRRSAPEAALETLLKLILKSRSHLIELSIVISLMVLGVFAYLMIQNRPGLKTQEEEKLPDRNLQEGLYHYRLDNLDRAEMLFLNVFEHSKRKKIQSLAAVYLGNIYFKKGEYNGALDFYLRSVNLDRKNFYAYHNAAVACTRSGEWEKAGEYVKKALSIKEDFIPALLLSGNMHYGSGRTKRALSLYERGRGVDPLIDYNMAVLLRREGHLEESLKILREIVSNHNIPDILKGICYYQLSTSENPGFTGGRIGCLKAAIEVFPSSPELRFNAALLLSQEGMYDEALEILKPLPANMSSGNYPQKNYHLLLAQALFRSQNYNEALKLFRGLYDRNQEGWIAHVLGDLLVATGDYEGAETFYKKAALESSQKNVLCSLAMLYSARGENEKALEKCEEYIKSAPDDPFPHLCMADIYFVLGSDAEARRSLDTAIALAGSKPEILIRAADIYLNHGRYSNALQLYYRVEGLKPELDHTRAAMAEVYLSMGQKDRAKKVLIKIRNTTSSQELYYRASLRLAQIEEPENASKLYEELIEVFPLRYEAYFNLAHLRITTGDFKGGLLMVQRCLDSLHDLDSSKLSMLHTLKGVAYISMGNVQDGLRAFHLAKELDPENEIAAMNLRVSGEVLH